MEQRNFELEYRAGDNELKAEEFIAFANKVWPGDYDLEKTEEAISKTLNITARHNNMHIGALRILTDGYFFGTITELLVLPEYQRQRIGSRLLALAKDSAQTILYFGAQPGKEPFYEKNGCKKGMQSYVIEHGE